MIDPDKFAKVLALAESDHHGEAQSALRAARIMLARAGMTFRDLASGAREPKQPPIQGWSGGSGSTNGTEDDGARRQVRELETRVRELEERLEKSTADLVRQRQETVRWHKLARETAERLWDLGKALERNKSRVTVTDRRRALIECLRDPVTALWSDEEIRRRLGVSVHAVAWWRRHLGLIERTRHLARTRQHGRRLYRSVVARLLPNRPDRLGRG